MPQHYTDPAREKDPYALPDIETFTACVSCAPNLIHQVGDPDYEDCQCRREAWYYWPCFPGCLPDGDAVGPFPNEAAAVENARAWMEA